MLSHTNKKYLREIFFISIVLSTIVTIFASIFLGFNKKTAVTSQASAAAPPNTTCTFPYDVNCCVADSFYCPTGQTRYRWYACELNSRKCSDICWIKGGKKGKCLVDCPYGVGPNVGQVKTCCDGLGGTCPPTPPALALTGALGAGLSFSTFCPSGLNWTCFQTWLSKPGIINNILAIISSLAATTSPTAGALMPSPTPIPALSLTPIALPTSDPKIGQCLAPFDLGTTDINARYWLWDNQYQLLAPASQDQNLQNYPCGINYIAADTFKGYLFRECSQPGGICYYECIDKSNFQRKDCFILNVMGTIQILSFYIDPYPRMTLKIINRRPDPIQLQAPSPDNVTIRIRKENTTTMTSHTLELTNNDVINPFKPPPDAKNPDKNTYVLDLMQPKFDSINCNHNWVNDNLLYKVSISVALKDKITNQWIYPGTHFLNKVFKCERSFDAVMEIN